MFEAVFSENCFEQPKTEKTQGAFLKFYWILKKSVFSSRTRSFQIRLEIELVDISQTLRL